ncbi:MAG: integrase [Methanobrevibacter sp.]|nr:site-specific tyrosine recombinase/integron integrase [Methanobrevibacter sp.]MBE6490604.1 integrase [Methanobrevibacter sp.]
MKNELIRLIESNMEYYLNEIQIARLNECLKTILNDFEVFKKDNNLSVDESKENHELLVSFLSAKQIEGCSEKTIDYYRNTIFKMLKSVNLKIESITTDDLRKYLAEYKNQSNASKSTIDNIRRVLSSFFSWLEDEGYISKNPVRRIHRIKTKRVVKDVLSDENFEVLRDKCDNIRDLAMVELLASTGIRVGELVNLNIDDVLFSERECVVLGKGDSERIVYFDAKTKIHLQKYLESRNDNSPALFVSLRKPYERLGIPGIEKRMRKLGHEAKIKKIHPHKFRRTMATNAIDKGMPIEQVQRLLGHVQIDTTMQYAMVNQNNVKISHRKFIG